MESLLFVASLIDYNCVLYEDNRVNSMWECVELFSEMTRLKCFENCTIILILNKDDLFKNLLLQKDNGLARCFSSEGIWPCENEFWDKSIDETYWPLLSNTNGHNSRSYLDNTTYDTSKDSKNNNDNNEDNNNNNIDSGDCQAVITDSNITAFNEFHTTAYEFIKKLFLARNNSRSQSADDIYCYPTVAIENKIVSNLFSTVQIIVINANLKHMAFLSSETNVNVNVNVIGGKSISEEIEINDGRTPTMNDNGVGGIVPSASATASMTKDDEHSVVTSISTTLTGREEIKTGHRINT